MKAQKKSKQRGIVDQQKSNRAVCSDKALNNKKKKARVLIRGGK